MRKEEWRWVKGYEGLYQVSNYGRVRGVDRYRKAGYGETAFIKGKILTQRIANAGYYQITLSKGKLIKRYLVHRLVAFAFPEICGEYFEGAEVNHIDENPVNNFAWNLEWVTPKYNCNWGSRNERIHNKVINGKCSKIVLQYSINGDFIREWPSTRQIERETEFNQGNISSCCNGKYKTAYGYIWKYK